MILLKIFTSEAFQVAIKKHNQLSENVMKNTVFNNL